MKKIAFAPLALAALVSSTAGCIIIDDSEPTLGVTWRLFTNDQLTACPLGYDTVRVTSYPAGTTDENAKKVDLFDCARMSEITAPIPRGQWDVYVDITDRSLQQVYAAAIPQTVDLNGDRDIVVDIHNDKGYLFGAWTLRGQVSNAPLSCASAGIPQVEFNATASGNLLASQLDCNAGAGYSRPLPVGLFDVAVQAIGTDNLGVGQSHAVPQQAVQAPNRFTNIGTALLIIPGI